MGATPDPIALLRSATPQLWLNPNRGAHCVVPGVADGVPLGPADMQGAQDRFGRFAPVLETLFPELAESQGRIESALMPVPHMQQALGLPPENGRLWVKADHSLPVAGSIKARGGFHEVLAGLSAGEKVALDPVKAGIVARPAQ